MPRPTRPSSLPIAGGSVRSHPPRAERKARQVASPLVQPDLFDYIPPVRRTHLPPEEAPLFVVTTRAFSDRDREDGWLYCLVSRDEGSGMIRLGLPLDPRNPLLLCSRPAVFALLATGAEETGPDDGLLLRVRLAHVAPWLEEDPDMSAQLGASCYLLSRQTALG